MTRKRFKDLLKCHTEPPLSRDEVARLRDRTLKEPLRKLRAFKRSLAQFRKDNPDINKPL